jgi:hypothetical protein
MRFERDERNFKLVNVAIDFFFALLRFEGGCAAWDRDEMLGDCPRLRASFVSEVCVII